MKFFKSYGLFIFWAILLLDCLTINYGITEYHGYLKLLLMPTLALYFFTNTRRTKHYSKKFFVYLSLIAAFVGDYFMLKSGNNYFIVGMVCFVIAYGLYGFLFSKMQRLAFNDATEALFTVLIMVVLCFGLFKVLQKGELGGLKTYILIYMGLLVIVTALAVNIVKNKKLYTITVTKIIPGILIICASDAILAVHKFYLDDIEFLPVVVMLTYGFGQALIIEAFSKYLKSN